MMTEQRVKVELDLPEGDCFIVLHRSAAGALSFVECELKPGEAGTMTREQFTLRVVDPAMAGLRGLFAKAE